MNELYLLLGVTAAIFLLLYLVLKLKIHAFISLIVVSMLVGVLTGMELGQIIKSIQEGMGSTLGFVATVVGLGAIFGQILEASGGAESIARYLLKKSGEKRAPIALTTVGFIVAIPVFFEIGLLILVPIIYALTKKTGKSLLYYGIPLVAGLAVTHAFIPPTPGPIVVAEILGVQLGWMILFGAIIGLPTAFLAGPVFGNYISKRMYVTAPDYFDEDIKDSVPHNLPSFGLVISTIALPLVLIIINSVIDILYKKEIITNATIHEIFSLIGHPFFALTLATLLALYLLGTRMGFSKDQLMKLSDKALSPAGMIILVTGAGGVLKQILIDSGVGEMLANNLADSGITPLVLAYILAAIVRIVQGSATVSMITAAGIMAPILPVFELGQLEMTLVALAVAAGSTIFSHVNDSGFWLVGKYFGLNEKQTLSTWTILETIISLVGFALLLLFSLFI